MSVARMNDAHISMETIEIRDGLNIVASLSKEDVSKIIKQLINID